MILRGYTANLVRVAFAAVLSLILIAGLSLAQTPTGEITGTVSDSTGGVVPDANVTVTNTGTGAQRSAKTNDSGIYDFAALTPGTYNLKIEKEGFNSEIRNNIELQVAQVANFDTTLNPGNVSQSVNVEAEAIMLQTEDATVGTVVENRRIEDLPLNGRNFLSLTALTPGTSTTTPVNQVASAREGGTRGSFTVTAGGQRVYFNFYSLDGADNTDVNYNAYIFLPSLDGIQEFKVETGILPAEYGHNLTQVNVTTKSGANDFHGAAFEYLRNSAISAKNFFDKPNPTPIPPFKRNQFGADAGGPIKKNKLFFFGDYEGLRERKSINRVDSVPSLAETQGDFSGTTTTIYDPSSRVFTFGPDGSATGFTSAAPFGGNKIPASQLTPISQRYLAAWIPLPNVGSVNNGALNNYVTSLIQPTNNDNEIGRVDYIQSSNMNWMIRYAHANEYQAVPGSFGGIGLITNSHVQQGMIGNTWTSGGSKVNDFRVSINYLSNVLPTYNSNKNNVVGQLGIGQYPTNVPFDWGVPGLGASGISNAGEIQSWENWDAHANIRDNFAWIVGKHSFKFGGEYARIRFNGLNNTYGPGSYSFTGQYTTGSQTAAPTPQNAIADLLMGNITQDTGLFGSQVFRLRWNYVGLFAEDTWKLTSKLTLTYGIRWEDQTPPVSKDDDITNLIFKWDNSMTPYYCRAGSGDPYRGGQGYLAPQGISFISNGTCNSVFNNDPLNFAPRLGVAYSLNSKTVLRGGAGIFFAHDIGNGFIELDRNIPWSLIQQNHANPVQPNLTLAAPFPPPALPSFTSAEEQNEPTSRSYQWSFGIQRQLYQNATLEVTYVGSNSAYLPGISTYDTAPPGPGSQVPREPFPQFGGGIQVTHDHLHSSFDQLQVKYQQRLSNGFSALDSFSYGKAIDNGSSYRPISNSSDSRDPNSNASDIRGLSSFNFKFRNATSLLYELPFGTGKHWLSGSNSFVKAILGDWQAGGILTIQTGTPLSPFCTSQTTFENGWTEGDTGNCFPNATGIDPNNGNGIHTRTNWFNQAAFVNQTPYSAGNAGRNTIIGPGIVEMDASLIKHFRITERQTLEFRAECFNVANHPIWNAPGNTIGIPGSTGVITSTIIDSREFQGALKFTF